MLTNGLALTKQKNYKLELSEVFLFWTEKGKFRTIRFFFFFNACVSTGEKSPTNSPGDHSGSEGYMPNAGTFSSKTKRKQIKKYLSGVDL